MVTSSGDEVAEGLNKRRRNGKSMPTNANVQLIAGAVVGAVLGYAITNTSLGAIVGGILGAYMATHT